MPTTILDGETYTDALQRRYSEEVKTDKRMNIIELAKEACAPNQTFNSDPEWVERFFNLAFAAGAAHERDKYLDKLAEAIDLSVKAEREACAKVCDEMRQQANADNASDNYPPTEYHAGRADMAKGCAGLIRARVAAPEDKK